jgi:hypothetical protein
MSKGGSQTQSQSVDPQIKQAYLDNLELSKSTAGGLGVKAFADPTATYNLASTQLSNIGLGGFNPSDVSQWMNPYQDEVVNSALADIERQRQIQQVGNAGQATMARAFGGSRQGVVEAGTNEAALRTGASTAANLRNTGYQNAVANAMSARTANLQGLGTVMTAEQQRQMLEQQRLDAARNLPLEQLAIQQSAMSAQPANLGMTSTTPTSQNAGAGALGGAGLAYALGATNPLYLGGAALLGSGLLG